MIQNLIEWFIVVLGAIVTVVFTSGMIVLLIIIGGMVYGVVKKLVGLV